MQVGGTSAEISVAAEQKEGERRTITTDLGLTLYGHIKNAEQRAIIQQYGDWYTGWLDKIDHT